MLSSFRLHARRFYSRKDAMKLVKSAKDFRRRRVDEGGAGLIIVVTASLTYMAMQGWVLYNLLKYTDNLAMPWDLPGLVFLQGATAVLFVFLAVFFYRELVKLNHYLDCSEFQSLMFASGMNLHANFSFIINKEKDIVYSDNKAAVLFGYEGVKEFTQLSDHDGISDRARAHLSDAIEQQKSAEIVAAYTDGRGEKREMRICIDPLMRPNGYCVIRGYTLQ